MLYSIFSNSIVTLNSYFSGLNVYSMLKHDTLVLTLKAARLIEEKLLFQLNRADAKRVTQKFKMNQ